MTVKFKSQKQLERFLLKKCRLAMIDATNEVYAIIKEVLYNYYLDYDPVVYERTYQLLQSLVVPRIVSDGKGYKAEIYFDLDKLKYNKSDWQKGNAPTGEQVFDAAGKGLHGAIGDAGGGYQFYHVPGKTGASIWPETELIMDAVAIDTLKDALIAYGIPIK